MDSTPGVPRYDHDIVAGRLCLELTNTVGGMRGHATTDHLATYDDLVGWARAAGAVDDRAAARLVAAGRARPDDAARVLADARALREAIFAAVTARMGGRTPNAQDLGVLNAALARALARRRVACCEGGLALAWDDDPAALDAPLWPVAASAADLLTDAAQVARVRMCGEAEVGRCGWLFLDETRSGTRRWCTMGDCGNRAKARRHYRKKQGAGG